MRGRRSLVAVILHILKMIESRNVLFYFFRGIDFFCCGGMDFILNFLGCIDCFSFSNSFKWYVYVRKGLDLFHSSVSESQISIFSSNIFTYFLGEHRFINIFWTKVCNHTYSPLQMNTP